jgi:hypothetical protein
MNTMNTTNTKITMCAVRKLATLSRLASRLV